MDTVQLLFFSLVGLIALINIGIIIAIIRFRSSISANKIHYLLVAILGISDIGMIGGLILLCLKLAPALM